MDRLYRNQRGELVARERLEAFGYGREKRAQQAAASSSGGGWSPAVEEVIEGERTGYQPPTYEDCCWEDVEEGEALPGLGYPRLLAAALQPRLLSGALEDEGRLRQHPLQYGDGGPLPDGLGGSP